VENKTPAVRLQNVALMLGGRLLWRDLSLEVYPGEFIAVLGPNGSGKTSLLKVLLGLLPITDGLVQVCGSKPTRGSSHVGYVPQRQTFDTDLPLRGIDLVRLGLDGYRFGLSWRRGAADKRILAAIQDVGAGAYAYKPIGLLSGGEQQRLRIAQALVGDPQLLLCDEPLLSLDLSHQQAVSALIDERRRKANTAVVFVTHEINPILPLVDRVVYLVGGRFAIGKPEEILTSETLSELYGTSVDVIRIKGRIVVVGTGEGALTETVGHHSGYMNGRRA
jgi:zinc/manganese transport system ATP-binding protein